MQATDELLEALTGIIEEIDMMPTTKQNYYEVVHKCDLKRTDLLHILENGTFRSYELVRIANELKAVSKERRVAKENYELIDNFLKGLGNLQSDGGRHMLKEALHRRYREINSEYRNRIYTDEDIERIIGGTYE